LLKKGTELSEQLEAGEGTAGRAVDEKRKIVKGVSTDIGIVGDPTLMREGKKGSRLRG